MLQMGSWGYKITNKQFLLSWKLSHHSSCVLSARSLLLIAVVPIIRNILLLLVHKYGSKYSLSLSQLDITSTMVDGSCVSPRFINCRFFWCFRLGWAINRTCKMFNNRTTQKLLCLTNLTNSWSKFEMIISHTTQCVEIDVYLFEGTRMLFVQWMNRTKRLLGTKS